MRMRVLVLRDARAGWKCREGDDDVGMIGHGDRLADDRGVGARDRCHDHARCLGSARDGKRENHSQRDDKKLHGSSKSRLVHAQTRSQQGLSPSYPTAPESWDNGSWIIIRNLSARTRTVERFGERVSKSQNEYAVWNWPHLHRLMQKLA